MVNTLRHYGQLFKTVLVFTLRNVASSTMANPKLQNATSERPTVSPDANIDIADAQRFQSSPLLPGRGETAQPPDFDGKLRHSARERSGNVFGQHRGGDQYGHRWYPFSRLL
jgi:hypothetical protein